MTDEETKARARDEHLIAAMAVVLTSGYAIERDSGRAARLDRVGDAYGVLTLEPGPGVRPVREIFDDVHEAIRYYLDACEG